MLPAIGVAVALSRWLLRAPAPDGFDSIDFLLGMSRGLDLEKLQPHFPGYPVYVGLGSALCQLGLSPLAAATAISSVASGATAIFLGRIAGREAGPWVAILHGVAWQPWLLGGGALSDSLGMAFAAASFAFMDRPLVSGLSAGALLGTRLSYWPLALALLVVTRGRTLVWIAVATLAWAIPFFAGVGVDNFWHLGVEHLRGHFGSWGGTRYPFSARAGAFVRDLFYDGLAPSGWTLVACGLIAAWSLWRTRPDLTRPRQIALVLAPYALWVLLAQNVVEQPRHLLPIAEGFVLILGITLTPLALGALALAFAVASVPLAWERHVTLPAPAQAAAWISQTQPRDTLVMANRSYRFFEPLPVHAHAWLSEVVVDLSRLDHLPANIWLTSEIDTKELGRGWRLIDGPRFCRDPRIDRADTCLGLTRLEWTPGP